MAYKGTQEWWVEAETFGRIKASRKIEVTVICGSEVVSCVDCAETRTVVFSRTDTQATPYYEVQSLTDPNIPTG